jgi:hypothetical protein
MPNGGNGHAPHIDTDRLTRVEALLSDIQRQLDVQFQRTAELQVQLDRAITGDRSKPK